MWGSPQAHCCHNSVDVAAVRSSYVRCAAARSAVSDAIVPGRPAPGGQRLRVKPRSFVVALSMKSMLLGRLGVLGASGFPKRAA